MLCLICNDLFVALHAPASTFIYKPHNTVVYCTIAIRETTMRSFINLLRSTELLLHQKYTIRYDHRTRHRVWKTETYFCGIESEIYTILAKSIYERFSQAQERDACCVETKAHKPHAERKSESAPAKSISCLYELLNYAKWLCGGLVGQSRAKYPLHYKHNTILLYLWTVDTRRG